MLPRTIHGRQSCRTCKPHYPFQRCASHQGANWERLPRLLFPRPFLASCRPPRLWSSRCNKKTARGPNEQKVGKSSSELPFPTTQPRQLRILTSISALVVSPREIYTPVEPNPAEPAVALMNLRKAPDTATCPILLPAQLYASLPLLRPQSIRVLGLSSAIPTDPLCGTLRVVDLETSPLFTALSYVWGQKSPVNLPSTISCNDGCQLNITPNCHDALIALHHRPGKKDLTIWVDAICINQQDDKEKSVQPPLMGSIYTFAETVWVWLGVGSDATDQAKIGCSRHRDCFPQTQGFHG